MPKTIAYIRVSTDRQDLRNQRHEILEYCNANRIHVSDFIEVEISSRKTLIERRINELLSKVERGDTIVVSELSRLGRSIIEVIQLITELARKGVSLIAVKQGLHIKAGNNGNMDMQSKVMITIFSLLAELERDIISLRTKDALAAKRANGVKLGRPKGKLGKSELDDKKAEIEHLLSKKVSISAIARIFGMSRMAVRNFIKTRLANFQSKK